MQTHIFLGADHGGFEIKEEIKQWLMAEFSNQYNINDLGATVLDLADDYPQFAFAVAERVAEAQDSLSDFTESTAVLPAYGILFCRSGGGMSIAANKVSGIRAVPVSSVQEAKHAREHNNAHIISVDADWSTVEEIKEIIATFLTTPFSLEPRHVARLQQITVYEKLE